MSSVATTLTPQQQFERDGFYRHETSVLSPDLLSRAAQALTDVRNGTYATGVPPMSRSWNPGDDPNGLAKLDNAHLSDLTLVEALADSGLGELADRVTGAEWVQVWALQGLYKPPTPGHTDATNIGWHQDQTYWSEIFEAGGELFTAWLALSDVTVDSGPMQFVPRSHTWGQLGGDVFSHDQENIKSNLKLPPGAEWTEVADVLPAGGVSFHHRLLLHGSNQNVSAEPRLSLAIHLRTERSTPLSLDHPLTSDLDDPERCPVIFRR